MHSSFFTFLSDISASHWLMFKPLLCLLYGGEILWAHCCHYCPYSDMLRSPQTPLPNFISRYLKSNSIIFLCRCAKPLQVDATGSTQSPKTKNMGIILIFLPQSLTLSPIFTTLSLLQSHVQFSSPTKYFENDSILSTFTATSLVPTVSCLAQTITRPS